MAQEVNRKTSTRRIKNPDGDGTPSDADVIVEVIDEISFIDPSRQYQQFTWVFDNSDAASRQVHAVTVHGTDGASKLDVERVDQYKVVDPTDQYWETWTTLDNGSEDRFAVDYVPSGGDNRKTHDVKIHSKDGSAWLLIRRTDAFTVRGGADEQYWETEFSLDNKDADAGDPALTDLAEPTTTWDGTSINPPWRLDPFQNIIDVSWAGTVFVLGDDSGQIWYGASKTSEPTFEKLSAQFGDDNLSNGISPGAVACGSYALIKTIGEGGKEIKTPVFVLAGIDYQFDHYDELGGHILYTAFMVKASNDGRNWTTVHFEDNTAYGTIRSPYRMIWNETDKTFYMDVLARDGIGPYSYASETWASTMGSDWSIVNSISSDSGSSNPFFDAKCAYHWDAAADALDGYGFSNGQFGLDKSKKDSTETFDLGALVADGLLITTEDLGEAFGAIGYNFPINFAGGFWARSEYAGKGVFEVSSDNGDTWIFAGQVQPYDPGDATVGAASVICAAPKGDIK